MIGVALFTASAVAVLASLFVKKRKERFPAEEAPPSEKRPTIAPGAWIIYQRFRNTRRP